MKDEDKKQSNERRKMMLDVMEQPIAMKVKELLDQLHTLNEDFAKTEEEHKRNRNAMIPEDVKIQLDKVDTFYEEQKTALDFNRKQLEADIKSNALLGDTTIVGTWYQAVYSKGVTSWDTKGLNEAIKVLPQLEQYKKQGDPYISIKVVTKPVNHY
jgi:hypothetical protein